MRYRENPRRRSPARRIDLARKIEVHLRWLKEEKGYNEFNPDTNEILAYWEGALEALTNPEGLEVQIEEEKEDT